jgi:hypothetical protein
VGSLVVGSLFLACGKVTQVVDNEDEKLFFNLTYTIEVLSTQDIKKAIENKQKVIVNEEFTLNDLEIYGQVMSIKPDVSKDELSWGKAMLKVEKVTEAPLTVEQRENKPVTTNEKTKTDFKFKYSAQAYRKDGVELKNADHMWTKPNFEKQKWTFISKKIKRNLPYYLVRVYSSQNKYRFKIITEDEIDEKQVEIKLDKISRYDTCLAIIFLSTIESNPSVTTIKDSFDKIKAIITPELFELITYKAPKNEIKKFIKTEPVFIFDRALENDLVNMLNFLLAEEKEEALKYVEKIKELENNKKAKEFLIKKMKSISQN